MEKFDFLLEIGCEEIPARMITSAAEQLGERITHFLKQHRIAYTHYQTYATPRRLAVVVQGVAEKQADQSEEVRGPALRIAKKDGDWTRAAEGFARKQGVSIDQLVQKEHRGEEYVYAQKVTHGEPTYEKMEQNLAQVIQQLEFPNTMRWNQSKVRFIRPIRWLVCLLGEQVIPISLAGVTASNSSLGHRFLGGHTTIATASSYVESLKKEAVLVDMEERKQSILAQFQQLEEKYQWTISVSSELLHEVVHLVEYPTVLYGRFSEEFLSLPKKVLTTTMKEHQRYFPIEDDDGVLLPYFITVRNGDDHRIEQVAKGNEKVLRARLSDARFFYETDQRHSIESHNLRLQHMVYQKELGTIADRVLRIKALSHKIGQSMQLTPTQLGYVKRAASISKMDLATLMVDEYPKLQGYMGAVYARNAGEQKEIVQAIAEQYLPRFVGDQLPDSEIGMALSLADHLDTLVTSLGIGIQSSGSQDPYGLRKRANSILQILLETNHRWAISLADLCSYAVDIAEEASLLKKTGEEVKEELVRFFQPRVQSYLQEKGIRYDIIQAVINSAFTDTYLLVTKADYLMNQLNRPTFKEELEGFTRVTNLALQSSGISLDESLLEEPAEKNLVHVWKEAKNRYEKAHQMQDVHAMYLALISMIPSIHQFFDQVMVMVDDEPLKENRLALLKEIMNGIHHFAKLNQIIVM